MILISACLIGEAVRYDGGHKLDQRLKDLVDKGEAITACPELLGGLSVPREPSEIVGGNGIDVWNGVAKVMTVTGRDVTEAFKTGAKQTLEIIQSFECDTVVLKANSPSCGTRTIYNGQFNGGKTEGPGVLSALLSEYNIRIYDEEEFLAMLEE